MPLRAELTSRFNILSVVRVAAIAIAASGWKHVGCPTDALVVALLWAVLSAGQALPPQSPPPPPTVVSTTASCAGTERRPYNVSGAPSWAPSWLCEHHAVVAVGTCSLAVVSRRLPAGEHYALRCAWMVGELVGGLVHGWWRRAAPLVPESRLVRRSTPPARATPQADDEPSFSSIQFRASCTPGPRAFRPADPRSLCSPRASAAWREADHFLVGIIVVLMLFCILFAFEEDDPVSLFAIPTREQPVHVKMARCDPMRSPPDIRPISPRSAPRPRPPHNLGLLFHRRGPPGPAPAA